MDELPANARSSLVAGIKGLSTGLFVGMFFSG
jgi:hypothetical protein